MTRQVERTTEGFLKQLCDLGSLKYQWDTLQSDHLLSEAHTNKQVAACPAQHHAHACVPEYAAGTPVPVSCLPGLAPVAPRALSPALQGGLHGQEDSCTA